MKCIQAIISMNCFIIITHPGKKQNSQKLWIIHKKSKLSQNITISEESVPFPSPSCFTWGGLTHLGAVPDLKNKK